MKKRNIFLVCNSLNVGGVQKKIIDIENYIHEEKLPYQIHIIILVSYDAFYDKTFLSSKDTEIHFLREHYPRFTWHPKALLKLSLLILKYRPIFILTYLHYFSPEVVFVANLLRTLIPFEVGVSQDNILSYENSKGYHDSPRKKKLISFFYNRADYLITQTKKAKEDLVQHFSQEAEKIFVIPNWVNLNKVDISSLVQKPKPIDVLYLGRLARQKNLERFLDVIALLQKEKPNVNVQIVGSGDSNYILKLRKKIDALGLSKNVALHHAVFDTEQKIIESKVLLLTSDFEGQPMVVMEAMSLGTCVVARQFPGSNEYIFHEENGLVGKTTQQLSTLTLELITNKTKRVNLAKKAFTTSYAKFDPRDLIAKTLAIGID